MNVIIADRREKSGKTTLAVNLSAVLAEAGSNVLLVDADPDGRLDTLHSLSETGKVLDRQGLQMLRYTSLDRLQVVTGTGRRLAFTGLPTNHAQPEPLLPPDLASAYDWVIFDTSTAHQAITAHVTGLSDRILAPLQVESAFFRSVPETLKFFLAEQQVHADLKFEGFVRQYLTPSHLTDSSAQSDAEATLTAIRREFPQVCLEVEIPFDDALASASDQAPAIINAHDIHRAFSSLAQELTTRLDGPSAPLPQASPSQAPAPTEELPAPETRQRRS